jgi:hypothetical protein
MYKYYDKRICETLKGDPRSLQIYPSSFGCRNDVPRSPREALVWQRWIKVSSGESCSSIKVGAAFHRRFSFLERYGQRVLGPTTMEFSLLATGGKIRVPDPF